MVFPSFFPANTPSPPLLFLSFMVLCFIYFIFFLFLFCFLFFSRFNLSALIRIGTTKSALLHPFFKYLGFDSKIVNQNLPPSRLQKGALLHPFFKYLVFDPKIINQNLPSESILTKHFIEDRDVSAPSVFITQDFVIYAGVDYKIDRQLQIIVIIIPQLLEFSGKAIIVKAP